MSASLPPSFQPPGAAATSAMGSQMQGQLQRVAGQAVTAAMMAAVTAVMSGVTQLLKRAMSGGLGGGGMGGAPGMGMGGMPMMGGMPTMGPPMQMPGMAPMGMPPMGMPQAPGMAMPGALPGALPGAIPAPVAAPFAGVPAVRPGIAAPTGMPGNPGLQLPQGAPSVPGTGPQQPQNMPGLQTLLKPGQAPASSGPKMPSANDKAPPGKSAEQIINDNPTLKNLGHQKDIKREELKKRVGDWENDPDPQKRADAAQRLSNVLDHIKGVKGRDGSDRGKVHTNGKIEGITKDGDARHGSEAGVLKDFAEKGYGSLPQSKLPPTKDSHVRVNGTNMDNFQWGCKQAGKALFFIPGLSNVLTGIGNSEGGFGGALKGAFSGVVTTWKNNIEGAFNALKRGKINPVQMLGEMYKANIANSEQAPAIVKDIANKIP